MIDLNINLKSVVVNTELREIRSSWRREIPEAIEKYANFEEELKNEIRRQSRKIKIEKILNI
jgi:hypothetical protein